MFQGFKKATPYGGAQKVEVDSSPSVLCITSICLSFLTGKGKDKHEKGSKVTEIFGHTGQTTVDFKSPWKRSRITESLRFLYSSQASAATSSSGRLPKKNLFIF